MSRIGGGRLSHTWKLCSTWGKIFWRRRRWISPLPAREPACVMRWRVLVDSKNTRFFPTRVARYCTIRGYDVWEEFLSRSVTVAILLPVPVARTHANFLSGFRRRHQGAYQPRTHSSIPLQLL